MRSIRIVLADDHALMRGGIRALLSRLEGMEVVGEAADGRSALQLIEQHQPRVALIDIAMPEMNGLEVVRRLPDVAAETRSIIVSMYATEEYIVQALNAGAAGYLLKDSSASELELAVRSVAAGQTYLSPAIAKHVSDYVRRVGQTADVPKVVSPLASLSPRQREVLQLIAEGNTTKQIAQKLQLGIKTVESHRTQLMNQLDVHDIAGLVRFAIATGVITAVR